MSDTPIPEAPAPMPAASPVSPVANAAEDSKPVVEHHAPTGTDLVTYTGDGLTASAVTIRALGDGFEPIAAPDQLDPDTWRVQVRTKE